MNAESHEKFAKRLTNIKAHNKAIALTKIMDPHAMNEEHRHENKRLMSRISAFDRRYLHSYKESRANQALQRKFAKDSESEAKELERLASLRRASALFTYRSSTKTLK